MIKTVIEGRIWAGSLHLYNSGYLVGEWFDIDSDTCPIELQEQIEGYIKEHLPKGESYEEAIDKLFCFDHELPCMKGQTSPSGAIKHLEQLAEALDDCGYDLETYEALVKAGCNPTDYDVTITPIGSLGLGPDWSELADQLGDYEQAGTYASYVNWERFYNDNWSAELINDTWYAIACN